MLDRWQIRTSEKTQGDRKCHILTVLEGALRVAGDADDRPLSRGGTILLPAGLGQVELTPANAALVLDAYLP